MQYYDQWVEVLRKVQKVVPSTAGSWQDVILGHQEFGRIHRNLADGPRSLRNLDDTFGPNSNYTIEWKKKAHNMVVKLKPFSEVLNGARVSP
jgi:hypothetical protein